jgi:Phospholipase_D-nuclease N-terminal
MHQATASDAPVEMRGPNSLQESKEMLLFANLIEFNLPNSLFGLVVLVLDIVAIVSLLSGTGSVSHKVLWIVLILIFPCLGVGLYFLFGRSPQDA